MIFTGWKMISGLYHVAVHGKYGFGMAIFCGILVFRIGIFEGLLVCLVLRSFITAVSYRHQHLWVVEIFGRFLALFGDEGRHPVPENEVLDGDEASRIEAEEFMDRWAARINDHDLDAIVDVYDDDAQLWGTFASELVVGKVGVRAYFEHLLGRAKLGVDLQHGETRRTSGTVVQSGTDTFRYRRDGEVIEVPARYSSVCRKRLTVGASSSTTRPSCRRRHRWRVCARPMRPRVLRPTHSDGYEASSVGRDRFSYASSLR